MSENLWIDLVIAGLAVFLWIELKLKPTWVIVSVFLLFAAPADVLKEVLRDLWQFSTTSRPLNLIIIIGVVFLIGREWAERNRAQFDSDQARKGPWDNRSKYRGNLRGQPAGDKSSPQTPPKT